jgi:hypothetical protein
MFGQEITIGRAILVELIADKSKRWIPDQRSG